MTVYLKYKYRTGFNLMNIFWILSGSKVHMWPDQYKINCLYFASKQLFKAIILDDPEALIVLG